MATPETIPSLRCAFYVRLWNNAPLYMLNSAILNIAAKTL